MKTKHQIHQPSPMPVRENLTRMRTTIHRNPPEPEGGHQAGAERERTCLDCCLLGLVLAGGFQQVAAEACLALLSMEILLSLGCTCKLVSHETDRASRLDGTGRAGFVSSFVSIGIRCGFGQSEEDPLGVAVCTVVDLLFRTVSADH